MRRFVLLLICLACVFSVFGQTDGYQVRFKINGLKDTTVLVANYYGNGTYVKDTLKVDSKGTAVFKAGDDLPKGLYILVINDKKYFDFVVNNDRKFTMETEAGNPQDMVRVSDSPENILFYDYLKYNKLKYADLQVLQNKYKQYESSSDSAKVAQEQMIRLNKELIQYKLDIVRQHPDSFLAFMINAMKEPEIPEPPVLPNGRKDSTFAYRYFKSHFWDDMDLSDNRLLRTPVFHNKLKRYFDQVVIQQPDTIIAEIDRMVAKTQPDPEMFKYVVWFATYKYENSEVMGFDKIFVHIIETYYMTGQATWVQPDVLQNIIKKATKLKPLLIGAVAPNMIMTDTANRLVSMHSIKADVLMLLFWDPDCGHCEHEIPEIRRIYDKYKEPYNFEIFAVCSDTSLVKWKSYILKKGMTWINVDGPRSLTGNYHDTYDIITTPVIYILNDRKEIIAKHLKSDQIEMFLKNYLKIKPD